MKVKGKNHVFDCLPPDGDNKVVPMPEQDDYQADYNEAPRELDLCVYGGIVNVRKY